MHIHIPDGVFPNWLWITGVLILIPFLAVAIFFTKKDKKKLVVSSAITALMLIVFSIEILGHHLNFTSLSGIILGPWWSLLSITITNLFLALFGHGGITVAPINILINWVEALIAFFIFSVFLSKVKNIKTRSLLSGITVFFALFVSFLLFIGIIYFSGVNPRSQMEHDHDGEHHENMGQAIPLKEFAIITAIPTLIGAIIESILTSFMVIFIARVKPNLIK